MAQEEARPKRARKKKEPETAVTPVTPAEAVAFHAYLLWESGAPGDATEHWLRAERELAAA